jgi:hypothetical protein
MAGWEYMTDVITHGLLGRKEDELDRSALEERLNRFGADGEKDGHLLIFKRPA